MRQRPIRETIGGGYFDEVLNAFVMFASAARKHVVSL